MQFIGKLARRVRSAKVVLREGGVRDLASIVGPFLFSKQTVDVFVLDLARGYSAPSPDPRAEIRKATGDDLQRFRATAEGHQSEFYRDEIDGAEPFVAYWEGQPAHIAWAYDYTLPPRFIRLGHGEVEFCYGYTLREFRGRGLYGATSVVMSAEFARRGYRRLYGTIIAHGPAFTMGLEWALRRVSFEKTASVTHLRILGIQLLPFLSL